MKLKHLLALLCLIMSVTNISAQFITQSFTDPCTKVVTTFSIPIQGGTTIFFLNKSSYFTEADVTSGAFGNWINQTYADYRKVSPCGQQQGQVTQNQITSQIVSSTVQSVVGSIMSSAQSASMGGMPVGGSVSSSGTSSGGNDGASKNNSSNGGGRRNNSQNNGNSNNNNSNSTTSGGNQNGNQSNTSGGNGSGAGSSNNNQGGSTTPQGGGTTTGGNTTQGGNSSSQQPVVGSGGGNNGGSGTSGGGNTSNTQNRTEQKGEEVGATTTMNVDVRNDRGGSDNSSSDSGSGGGGGGKSSGGKSGGKSGGRTNPMIVSSDLTTAQNLDKSFTPILNLSMGKSSMTGMSSYGVTSMIWFNFKQFALSGRYTKIHFSKKGNLKFIHNFNLTSVYSYGNILGFVGYSGILNAGKWGVTGFNISAAASIIAEDKSGYYSPSITAFYTRPLKVNKRLIISPEIYIISTPLVYSSKEKVTVTDKYFSGFLGSGFDYTLTKRFKFNFNYKMNLSTNPEFPILSFFLIGSKINL